MLVRPSRAALAVSLFESLESRTLLAAQTPYLSSGPASVPGTIEAENFDKGGEGVAYLDTTSSNLSGKYRTSEGVDIQTGGSNGYNVGHIAAGEWMEYTINVKNAGTYQIDALVGSDNNGGKFHIEIDGSNKPGSMTLPNTGGWTTFKTVSKSGITLAGGTHVMRIAIDSSAKSGSDIGNIDAIKFTQTNGGSSSGNSFDPQPLKWKSAATNPLQREEAQSLVYGGYLYELGGYYNSFTASYRVDRYNPKTNKWTRMHDMPYRITHAAVAADSDGHDFWFVGGFKGSF